ncbi:aminodeoxychorismate synthase component I [Pararhodobacter sp. CCB-MM2]|uniref:aminodeoxychorismate synthase component I n=1 Tax=Pararhodobacter sp. CCB-MM2 TaxID=1786003 RepID=UPI000836D049|nr:aminodeoxychorismate synthase component I [Pararhodobacter sp. CCB-MM2]
MILIEHGPEGRPALFADARETLVAREASEVMPLLAQAEAARAQGLWVAGWIAYEAGYALEDRLRPLIPAGAGPLLVLGLYDAPQDAGAMLEQAEAGAPAASLAPIRPLVDQAGHAAAIKRVLDYIAAGDCYQINLTIPLASRLQSGTALGLYGALRARQAVGFGAYADMGAGPVLISRSPELFFRTEGECIESRPMKGTRPRHAEPMEDARLAAELRASVKDRAENLMIVDLLRNDISRIAQVGSVKVPELFGIDSFATVHQMSSTVEGRLLPGAGLPGLMAALFPCGSITGAPKIRAMQIIRELEPHPRGAYCGAIGWAAPDGAQAWSVAIRTLSLSPDGSVVLNVGGGVVQDSTPQGEWEEALWKAAFAGPVIPV